MRNLRIFTWHIHGSYLYYFSQMRHDIFVPYDKERSERHLGLTASYPWPGNLHEVPIDEIPRMQFDCVVFQSKENYHTDRFRILSPEQRNLPSLYIEHDPPRQTPTDTKHWVDDPNVMIVHVTDFNRLMWDSNRSPTTVIDHGIKTPSDVLYSGHTAKGVVVINNIKRRGRRLGFDIFRMTQREVPLDLVGMGWEEAGGVGEVRHAELFRYVADHRFYFNPIRYTSLGLGILEAMSVGCPIVGLATTELVTVIKNGENGIISTRPESLIDGMKRLLSDPAEARRLGEAGMRTQRERFGIERFVFDWETLLQQTVSGRSPRKVFDRDKTTGPLDGSREASF